MISYIQPAFISSFVMTVSLELVLLDQVNESHPEELTQPIYRLIASAACPPDLDEYSCSQLLHHIIVVK